MPFPGDLDCYYNQPSRRMVDYANHRLSVWCSQQQHHREALAISFFPAGCYFPARHLSLEYFTVYIIRQNKAILKVSVDTAYIGEVLWRVGRKMRWRFSPLQLLTNWMPLSAPSSLSLLDAWNFQGLSAVVYLLLSAFMCKCNFTECWKKKFFLTNPNPMCPTVVTTPT